MIQRYRWLACDGYTIARDDGRRISLHDLHTLRAPLPPLRRLGRAIGRWLLGPVRPAEFHCVAVPVASRNAPAAPTTATLPATPAAGRCEGASSRKAA